MTFDIEGEYTTARVMGLDPQQAEANLHQQIQDFVDSPAFTEPVRVMPDTHYGAGCPIGLTMPIPTDPIRVVPNAVGTDIGCGMSTVKLDEPIVTDELSAEYADRTIRNAVPMGRSVHDHDDAVHIGDEFWWDQANRTKNALLGELVTEIGLDNMPDPPDWFAVDGDYDMQYLKQLCRRVGIDVGRVISSAGTLGGGNHFIEVGAEPDGSQWITVHSGSRQLGLAIAEYWQEQATRSRQTEWIRATLDEDDWSYVVPDKDDPELAEWFLGGKGQSYIDSEKIRAHFDGQQIADKHDQIRRAHPERMPTTDDLAYLTGTEAMGYLIDMVFAQEYARFNRNEMLRRITDAIGVGVEQMIVSPHNVISEHDLTLRKGSTSAHDGQRFILPMHMAHGTFLCTGKGNDEWNNSAPHGAGRVMSRREAFREVDMAEFEAEMNDIYSSSVVDDTRDEAPMAYKDVATIKQALDETAHIDTHLEPVLNVKALE